jgi:protein tyrosine/serine phosphatase
MRGERHRSRFALLIALVLLTSFTTFAQITARTNSPARPATWAVRVAATNLSNFFLVTTNLYRGAQPSAKGMADLKLLGIKTVVNLRGFHSDDDEARGTGLKLGRLHMQPWHASDDDVLNFLKLATDTNNFPVFVHCQRGADRTGLMCAMYRVVVCDWTKDEAIAEMKDGGFRFNPTWKNLVRYVERSDVDKIRKQLGITKVETATATAQPSQH